MTDAAGFAAALRRQQEKYRALVSAGEEQKRLLAAADVDGLLALVGRKRALLGEIEALERDLRPVKERWPEARARMDAGAVREVEAALRGTRDVLAALLRLEDEAREMMERPAVRPRAYGR